MRPLELSPSARKRAFFGTSDGIFSHPSHVGTCQRRADLTERPVSSDAAWALSLSQHVEIHRESPGQTAALVTIGLLICFALAVALGGCQREKTPKPGLLTTHQRDLDDLDRRYLMFFEREIKPIADSDGREHVSGGCDEHEDSLDLLCVECWSGDGESWAHCNENSCELLDTISKLEAFGAPFGACARANGLSVAFERKRP